MKNYIKKNTKIFYDILSKTLTDPKPFRIRFDKIDGFIKIHDKLDIWYYLILVIVIKFVIRLNIL